MRLKNTSHGALDQHHSYTFDTATTAVDDRIISEVLVDPFWMAEVNPPHFDDECKTLK